jgi:hypothetical protein
MGEPARTMLPTPYSSPSLPLEFCFVQKKSEKRAISGLFHIHFFQVLQKAIQMSKYFSMSLPQITQKLLPFKIIWHWIHTYPCHQQVYCTTLKDTFELPVVIDTGFQK